MNIFKEIDRYLVDNKFKVIIEDNKVNIINYLEVEDFSNNKVIIKYREGKIILEGLNLVVSKMLDDEVLITGKLSSIVYK